MSGGKETPRQKMIGMMYLVLTALLAMNVSKQILKGFITVNDSLERSKENLIDNNKRVLEAFKASVESNPMAKPYYDKAVAAESEMDKVFKYIAEVKGYVIEKTEDIAKGKGDTSNLKYLGTIDNYDIPTFELLGSDERNPKTGPLTANELRGKLKGLHDYLVGVVKTMDPKVEANKAKLLQDDYDALMKKIETINPVDDPNEKEDGIQLSWEMQNFYHIPMAAVVTNLTKMQADVKNLEAEFLQQLSGASGKIAIKFDRLSAKVIAPSSYIQSGNKYVADIFLAASSSALSKDELEIQVGAGYDSINKKITTPGTVLPIEDGMGKYEMQASGVGEQKFGGVIKFKKPTGEFDYYQFSQTYMVAAPAAAISADAMNVFYIGVDNPVSVSAAGVAPSELVTNATGGGITMAKTKPGMYTVRVTTPGEATISVSAKMNGTSKPQGSKKFKVKRIPDPYASLAGKKTGETVSRGDMSVANYIFAKMDNFDFDAKFTVLKWDLMVVIAGKGTPVSGNGGTLSAEAKALLNKVGPASRIILEVTAKGPDGSTRTLNPMVLKVK